MLWYDGSQSSHTVEWYSQALCDNKALGNCQSFWLIVKPLLQYSDFCKVKLLHSKAILQCETVALSVGAISNEANSSDNRWSFRDNKLCTK